MWFLYALLGAVGKSYSGLFRKKMAGSVGSTMFLWITYFLILAVMTPFMFSRMPEVGSMFRHAPLLLFGAAISLMIATRLNLEALKREELSYTAPLNAFIPIFTLIIAGIFLNESPPKLGLLGIIAIFVGAYIVSLKPERVHWYDPLTRLVKSPGALLSIGSALGLTINSVLMKQMSNQGYGSFEILYAISLVGLGLIFYVPFIKRQEFKDTLRSNKLVILGATASSFAGNFFHILALASTYTSYAVSVRRFDAVIAVLLGWHHLKESNIGYKLIGSVIMVAGAVVMALS